MSNSYTCAECGHDMDTHYWDRCSACEDEITVCECGDDADIYDGCECCDCEEYREPEATAAVDADRDQLPLFGHAT
jgi:hypothetical protein